MGNRTVSQILLQEYGLKAKPNDSCPCPVFNNGNLNVAEDDDYGICDNRLCRFLIIAEYRLDDYLPNDEMIIARIREILDTASRPEYPHNDPTVVSISGLLTLVSHDLSEKILKEYSRKLRLTKEERYKRLTFINKLSPFNKPWSTWGF
jgi:hypothetical protein